MLPLISLEANSDLALMELISPTAPSQTWLQLKPPPPEYRSFSVSARSLLRVISNSLHLTEEEEEEEERCEEEKEDRVRPRDCGYLDDGLEVAPGSWPGWRAEIAFH